MGVAVENGEAKMKPMMPPKHWWIISVHGYGEFNFFGTEQQAEEMRRHKANWEHAVGKKRLGRLPTRRRR